MALGVRIKPRAQRAIERAAEWWTQNRLAAPGAVRKDVEAAVALLVEEPGIGTKVETPRSDVVRRLYLPRVRYFLYYRVRGNFIEVLPSGIRVAEKVRRCEAMTRNPAFNRTRREAASFPVARRWRRAG